MPKSREERSEEQRNRRQLRIDFVNEYKIKKGCYFCGEDDPIVLDFHHLNALFKESSIADLVNKQRPFIEISEEMKKCVVVCANDHRRVHMKTLTIRQ